RTRIEDLERLGPEAFAAVRARGLVHEPERKPEVAARVGAAMAAVRLPGYTQAARMPASGWSFDAAAAPPGPPMVICGAHDRVTPPAQTARVAQAVPSRVRIGNDVVLVADAGHAVMQEYPRAVSDCMAGLISVGMAAG